MHFRSLVIGTGLLCTSGVALAQQVRCQAELVDGYRIIRQLISYGYDYRDACDNAMNACDNELYQLQQRGQFPNAYCRTGQIDPRPPQPPQPRSEVIQCDSVRGETNYCYASAPIVRVELLRQDSRATCVQNRTFGAQRGEDYMWVSNGCRGQFRVFFSGRPGPIPPGPGPITPYP